jgi:trigger factor
LLHIFYLEDLPDRVKAWQPGSGEPLRLRVKVPEAFSDEVLRGVEVDLEFVLEETQRLEYPELDDSFAQSFQKGSLSELREEIRESLESRRRRREEARIEEKVLEKIIAAASMDLPESLLESQKKRWVLENELKLLREEGLSLEEAKQRLLSVGETAEEELRRGLKAFFILEKIAAKEKIYVTEEELNERLDLLATYYGVPVHKLREEMRKTGRLEELRHSLRQEKVQALLREGAKITGEVAQEAARNAATDPAEGPVEGADLTPGGERQGGEEKSDAGVAPSGSTS